MGKGNIMESDLYFMGDDFTKERLTRMAKKKGTNELTMHCKRRANWIKHLEKKMHKGANLDEVEKQRLINWATHTRMEDDHGHDKFQNEICSWIPE